MKTETKDQILKYIEENGNSRPKDLVEFLNISPQAIHRHLRALVSDGILEIKGSPPFTRYKLAGVPDFTGVLAWFWAKTISENQLPYVCETRDVFAARLSQLTSLEKQGLSNDFLPLVVSVAGEIGNNSFDHNLGQWRDVPGCWFESQVTGGRLWICIADRGQGIYRSLIQVDPTIKSDQSAIEIAFEKHISGRAPEKRGNGLKYVKNIIVGAKNRGLACHSGRGQVQFGEWGIGCNKILITDSSKTYGTITLLRWDLK